MFSGADKIYVNSAILQNKSLLRKNHFGSPNITACIEVICYEINILPLTWQEEIAQIDPFQWAKYCQDQGCGEILLTTVERGINGRYKY